MRSTLHEHNLVLADEVHWSHGDKAPSEELHMAIGADTRLMLFTGTARD